MSKKIFRKKQIFAAFILTIILSCTFIGTFVFGNDIEVETTYTNYRTITIKSEDTLWTLAEYYNNDYFSDIRTYIYEIKKFNNMHTDKLIVGQTIVVPVYMRK